MPPAFMAYIAPARTYPQLWRMLLGLMLILGIHFVWMASIGLVLWLVAGRDGLGYRFAIIAQGAEPWALMLLLATFPGMALGAWAAARLLHGRGWRSLFGPPATVARDFGLGVGVMALLGGGLGLLLLPLAPPLEAATDPRIWLAFLPLALIGILVQTGAEELVFRGYLQQQLAVRFASPLAWLVLPSVLFGLAHYAPEEMGGNAWLVVVSTGIFGLIAADLTARTGSLGLAWGLHFANNVLAILVISAMAGLDGLALFRLAEGADAAGSLRPLLLADMVLMALVWAACVLWLRRR
ncbi:MAG: CPBP family intramembrane metalloprotease [Pararhodobacter sp.]|nr:CPBP family intramembrane metalloprotease [Pararhodobacter sp.]